MFRKMNKKRDIRRIYRTIEGIHDARSPREADVLTGYAFGIVDEMFTGKRITASMADAFAEIIETIGEDIHKSMIREKDDGAAGADEGIIDFDNYQGTDLNA